MAEQRMRFWRGESQKRLDALDRVLAQLDAERAAHAETRREFMEAIVNMKRDGFAVPTAQPAVEAEPTLPAEVQNAINERARYGSLLHDQMVADARISLQKLEPAEVARRILRGGSAPDGEPWM